MNLVSQNFLVLANIAEITQTDIGQIWIDQELNLDSISSKESNFRLIFLLIFFFYNVWVKPP